MHLWKTHFRRFLEILNLSLQLFNLKVCKPKFFLSKTIASILSNSRSNCPHFMTEFFPTPSKRPLRFCFKCTFTVWWEQYWKKGENKRRIFIATSWEMLLTFMVKSVSTAGVNYKSQRGIWVLGRGCLFEPLGPQAWRNICGQWGFGRYINPTSIRMANYAYHILHQVYLHLIWKGSSGPELRGELTPAKMW